MSLRETRRGRPQQDGHRFVFFKAEMPPAFNVKAGGEIRMRQATAILGLTLFAALAMSAATASGFEI